MLYYDVWGPSPVSSFQGYCYYFNFVDDFSRYTWLFPLVNKSDVSKVLQSFVPFAENLLSFWLKVYCTDSGGEFIN